jgi:uncharacterized membrane protein YkoI
MVPRFLRRLLLSVTLMLVATTSVGAASGRGCLPPSQAPQGLAQFLGAIRALTGGVVADSCLKRINGRYVYEVRIRIGGVYITKYVDAATGALLP